MSDRKTVLITGCSSGFGLESVDRFLDAGWRVIATLRKARERESLFAELHRKHGSRLRVLELDVTRASDRDAVAAVIQREFDGRLDCLVNNAGYGLFGALEDASEAQIRGVMEVNFFGLALLTQSLLPALRSSRGRVINLSSAFGFSGFPLTSLYCASKFAVEGLSESLRIELAPFGVQVCCVEPGAHRTRFGSDAQWAEKSFSENSAYLDASQGYSKLQTYLSQRPKHQKADSVARAILKLAERRTMPARVACGSDAQSLAFFRQNRIGSWLIELGTKLIYQKRIIRK